MPRTIGDAMNDLWTKGIKPADDSKAPLDSPEFEGTPTAPTPAKNSAASDRLATVAYVLSLLKNDPTIIDEIVTELNKKLDASNFTKDNLTNTIGIYYLTANMPDGYHRLHHKEIHIDALDGNGNPGKIFLRGSGLYFNDTKIA